MRLYRGREGGGEMSTYARKAKGARRSHARVPRTDKRGGGREKKPRRTTERRSSCEARPRGSTGGRRTQRRNRNAPSPRETTATTTTTTTTSGTAGVTKGRYRATPSHSPSRVERAFAECVVFVDRLVRWGRGEDGHRRRAARRWGLQQPFVARVPWRGLRRPIMAEEVV